MSKGNLKFNVFNDNYNRPIEGAKIKIFKKEPVGDRQIEELTTSNMGDTTVIQLDCPDIELSLNENATDKPYAEYDIEVSSEGLPPTYIENVSVMSGTTALQYVNMSSDTSEDVINITGNSLYVETTPKEPENEIKDVRPTTGFVVLDKPVIPEFIVVHEGRPDTPGKNHWAYFKDYIKNVASSEIYPTWPKETIKANVLAIISFTLNRVYTVM